MQPVLLPASLDKAAALWRRATRWLAAILPKGLYARSLLIVILPMVLLQAAIAYVFMERHWQLTTSQLSAAVADLNGAGGLIVSASAGRVAMAVGYALTAAAAIAITWIANIYEIIAYASKAFVLYYGLQSIVALVTMSHTGGWRQALKSGLFGFAVLVSIAVLIFGIPADA